MNPGLRSVPMVAFLLGPATARKMVPRAGSGFDIRRIDDLSNAVLGAELETVQMAGGCVCGSLAFAARDGIVFGSGQIDGKVMITGPLSKNAVTLIAVLHVGPGTRLWLPDYAHPT